jgi:hypothetical protein
VNGPDDVYVERKGRIERVGERRHGNRRWKRRQDDACARGHGLTSVDNPAGAGLKGTGRGPEEEETQRRTRMETIFSVIGLNAVRGSLRFATMKPMVKRARDKTNPDNRDDRPFILTPPHPSWASRP